MHYVELKLQLSANTKKQPTQTQPTDLARMYRLFKRVDHPTGGAIDDNEEEDANEPTSGELRALAVRCMLPRLLARLSIDPTIHS